jgi:hypothetical protein
MYIFRQYSAKTSASDFPEAVGCFRVTFILPYMSMSLLGSEWVCRALTLSCYHFRQFLYQGTVPVGEQSTTDQDRDKANWAGHRRSTVHPTLIKCVSDCS